MAPRKMLGELLLEEGLIDEMQLRSAIGHQRTWGGKLGSTLVEMGFLKEEDIARVLEEQLRQRCLSEEELRPQPAALNLISVNEAMKYQVLPLSVNMAEVTLAMANPFDIKTIDELGFKLGKRVKGVMAVESSIKKAIKRHYEGVVTGQDYKVELKTDTPVEEIEVIHHESRFNDAPPKAETKRVDPSPDLISKALAYLLIEKGIIKRDELIDKMRALKEKGLV